MIGSLLTKGRRKENSVLLTNQAFTYIYLITKMRGYKVVIRYFPHEVSDLSPILAMLEVRLHFMIAKYMYIFFLLLTHLLSLLEQSQREEATLSWQTRYVLLLWLSIVVKIPFDLSRFDAAPSSSSTADSSVSSSPTTSTMDRILAVGKLFLFSHDVSREASAFMLSQFLTRPDVKTQRLADFISWSLGKLVGRQAGR